MMWVVLGYLCIRQIPHAWGYGAYVLVWREEWAIFVCGAFSGFSLSLLPPSLLFSQSQTPNLHIVMQLLNHCYAWETLHQQATVLSRWFKPFGEKQMFQNYIALWLFINVANKIKSSEINNYFSSSGHVLRAFLFLTLVPLANYYSLFLLPFNG